MNVKSGSKHILIISGFCSLLFVTVLRAIRLPNDWAEAHWLINYDFGFLKRGLPGTIFKPLIYSNGASNAELYISVISAFFLLVFYLILIYTSIRILKKNQFSVKSILSIILFITSPYIVMSAHLNGYADNILILISALAIWFVINKKFWAASFLIFISVFVHEAVLVIGLPSIICIAYFQYLREENPAKGIKLFFRSAYPLFIFPLIAFMIIVVYQSFLISSEIEKELNTHLLKFTFIENNRSYMVPESLTNSYIYFLETESWKFFKRIGSFANIIRIIPPVFLILFFIKKLLKSNNIPDSFLTIVIITTAMPLTLFIAAWDTHRIWTYPLISVFLVLWGLTELLPTGRENSKYTLPVRTLFIIVTAINIFINTPLMDNEYERFSIGIRLLLYSPPLIIILFSILKDYKNRKTT